MAYKSFHQQRYPIAIWVLIDFGDFQTIDAVKGLNTGHALHLAAWNWEHAISIQPLYGPYPG